jgi:hypothetical protein
LTPGHLYEQNDTDKMMFPAKYLSSSSFRFLKDILNFFLSVAMATRILLGINSLNAF